MMLGLSLDGNREQLVRFVNDKNIRWRRALLVEGFAHAVAKNFERGCSAIAQFMNTLVDVGIVHADNIG